MRILALIADYPYPPITGSRVRDLNLWLRVARLGHEVRLACRRWDRRGEPPPLPEEYRHPALDLRVHPHPRKTIWAKGRDYLLYSYHLKGFSRELAREVAVAADEGFDVIHAEELRNAPYLLPHTRRLRRPLLSLTLPDIETVLWRQIAGTGRWRRLLTAVQTANLKRLERRAVRELDVVFAYSPLDRERLRALYPWRDFALTRGGVDTSAIRPLPGPPPPPPPPPPPAARPAGDAAGSHLAPRLLFVGTLLYLPNLEAIEWFAREIMPCLGRPAEFVVAGSRPTERVRAAARDHGLTLIENPPDMRPVLAEAAVSVVPLRGGSGTRGKILESLAAGRPVVSTTIGAEGLDLVPGREILIADTPREFAAACDRLLCDPELYREIARRGRERVERDFDWQSVASDLLATLEHALRSAARPRSPG